MHVTAAAPGRLMAEHLGDQRPRRRLFGRRRGEAADFELEPAQTSDEPAPEIRRPRPTVRRPGPDRGCRRADCQ